MERQELFKLMASASTETKMHKLFMTKFEWGVKRSCLIIRELRLWIQYQETEKNLPSFWSCCEVARHTAYARSQLHLV